MGKQMSSSVKMRITANLNSQICMQCGLCAEECVFEAIKKIDEIYTVVDIACQSCGKCAAICPTNAVDLSKFGDIAGGLTNGLVFRGYNATANQYRTLSNWKKNGDGIIIKIPEDLQNMPPCKYAWSFKIEKIKNK